MYNYNPRFFFTLSCMFFFGAANAQTPPAPPTTAVPSPVIDPLHNDNAAKPPVPVGQALITQGNPSANINSNNSGKSKSRIQAREDQKAACDSTNLTPGTAKKNNCEPFPPDRQFVRPPTVER
ncbi:hypothetical protein ACO0LO_18015 [Undibacterium sp. TJN25]|uniref:hypothetical protein n=1 Tax=Undibacterium sp. TJN25 TaxID=3413056 RepID=UPI003BF01AD4